MQWSNIVTCCSQASEEKKQLHWTWGYDSLIYIGTQNTMYIFLIWDKSNCTTMSTASEN